MDERFERLLREATLRDPPEEVDSFVMAEIRREARRRRRRRLFLGIARPAAAAAAIAALLVNLRGGPNGGKDGELVPDEGQIALEIIGFASPCEFYAEETAD